MHARAAVAGTLSLLLVAGCAGSGGGALSDLHSRAQELQLADGDFARLGYRRDWVGLPDVAVGGRITAVVPFDDVVIVQESGSTITAMETLNGSRRWANQLGSELTKVFETRRVGDRLICSCDSDLYILRLDNGVIAARQRYDKVISTPPVLASNNEVAIYGTAVGQVLGHSLTLGLKRWAFDAGAAIEQPPVAVGEAVGVVARSGAVTLLNRDTGRLRGRGRTYGAADVRPVANDNAMFVASTDHSLYAFDSEGSQIWRYRTSAPLRVQPAVHGSVLYCEIPEQGLTAFDAGTGKVLWSAASVHGTVVGQRQDRLLVWGDGALTALDPSGGAVVDRVELPGAAWVQADAFVDGRLYVAGQGGALAKFEPSK